ncbi:transglycosylase SLT domain-containing protein [Citromicrobium sp. JLT1363]|uniref:lytic transglycosylase domain-containing protein n=1 Tax=Citromicrobium sp. JLT1363 TaxID=517722 RepID=UPI000225ED1D
MSSMTRLPFLAIALVSTTSITPPALAQDAASWDRARASLIASAPTQMAQVVSRWEYLIEQDDLPFTEYASFLLAYPDFPQTDRLRQRAEDALDSSTASPESLVAYFDALPPVTNAGRARYALALSSVSRPEAAEVAREAWRAGRMSATSEPYLVSLFGNTFTPADEDARMDALLWQSEIEAAQRQITRVSPANRDLFTVRLALIQGYGAETAGVPIPADARQDPGYVYNLAKYYRENRQLPQAIALLANRPAFENPAFDPEDFVGEALRIAQGAGSDPSAQIAAKVDDLFAPGTDISKEAYRLRDDYTSLMWLGGTNAYWNLGQPGRAAPLFYRYGAAAQTPQTRSKGFYWAGLAAERAGDRSESSRYYEMAAAYPDRFYGQLALAKLGRDMPSLGTSNVALPSAQQRAAFEGATLTRAVREVARGTPWRTGIQFYQAISDQADTPEEHALVAELARDTGRRDLAVNVAEAAAADGHRGFVEQGFPTVSPPGGADWTMVHAISRQESQFAANAISHAGARGLMQLMPATAREQAGQLGLGYSRDNLIADPSYNMQLGNAYFARMLDYYGGAYPLAIAAYNAGPGNVNRWLRANGDPRQGGIDYVTWIERIPIYETKNYVQRVIENAAVYEQLNPDRAQYGKPRMAGDFLR